MALSDFLGIAQSYLSPSLSVDVVAITAGGFSQVFANARPMEARVYEAAELMQHPLETGAKIADHIVFKPIEIELPLLCIGEIAYRSTYAAIRSTFKAGTLLTIRTRTGSYPDMVIGELPHEESGEAFDAISIRLHLVEAKFVTPKTGLASDQVANKSQASTADRGNQQTSAASKTTAAAATAQTPSKPAGSTLYNWYEGT